MMKYSIKFKNSLYSISSFLAGALTKSDINFTMSQYKNNIIFVLDNSNIFSFQVVKTTSSTHFYTLFLNKKYRICRQFYNKLFLNCKQGNHPFKEQLNKTTQLGQHFTTRANYILEGFSLPGNAKIVEPFAGNGDLVS